MIVANSVTKKYGGVEVLSQFSVNVPEKTVFALLGPNGAGKTTFIKILLGLTSPESGQLTIDGDSFENPDSRLSLAYLPEKFNFYSYYTLEDTLKFYGKMNGLSDPNLSRSVEESLKKLNILELAKRKVKTLSKGQLQRLGVACLLMGDKKIFILDEPFSGLDPIGIKDLKDLILELKEEGKTIFINSHILSEMEKMCDSFAILNKGAVLSQGKLKDLIKGEETLENYFYNLIGGQQ